MPDIDLLASPSSRKRQTQRRRSSSRSKVLTTQAAPPPAVTPEPALPVAIPLGPQLPDRMLSRAEFEGEIRDDVRAWFQKSGGAGWANEAKFAEEGRKLITQIETVLDDREDDDREFGKIDVRRLYAEATQDDISIAVLRIAGDIAPGKDPGPWVACRLADIAALKPHYLVVVWAEQWLRHNWEPPKNFNASPLPTAKQVFAAFEEAEQTLERLIDAKINLDTRLIGQLQTELAEGPARYAAECQEREQQRLRTEEERARRQVEAERQRAEANARQEAERQQKQAEEDARQALEREQRRLEAERLARVRAYTTRYAAIRKEHEDALRAVKAMTNCGEADKRQARRDANREHDQALEELRRASMLEPGDLPHNSPNDSAPAVDRYIVRRGEKSYDVIEGWRVNFEPLTEDAALALADETPGA
jgi:hypothetical protein